MFTVNHGVSVLTLCKFGDSFSGGDVPAGGVSTVWPYPSGHKPGFRESKTPDVRVAELLLPDIGGFMEKAQTFSAQARDTVTLGVMAVQSTIRKTRKSLPKF